MASRNVLMSVSMELTRVHRQCTPRGLLSAYWLSYRILPGRSIFNPLSKRWVSGSASLGNAQEKVLEKASPSRDDAVSLVELQKLDPLYLRGSCRCPQCVDQSTTQRLFDFASIPADIAVRGSRVKIDGKLAVLWANDVPGFENHQSEYTIEYLKELEKKLHVHYPSRAWDSRLLSHVKNDITYEYQDYLNSDTTLYKAVDHLLRHGITFITSVPSEHSSVGIIAQRIGPLRNSFYGETWDVKNLPAAKNVAYTSLDLGFHMDLLYMADPPGVQLLHCLKATSIGGESLFSDALQAFYEMQDRANAGNEEAKKAFQEFLNYPVIYRYKNDGQWYQRSRSFLEGGLTRLLAQSTSRKSFNQRYPQDFETINWSPPFQGPLEVATRESKTGVDRPLKNYRDGAAEFKAILERNSNVYETKLHEGTCVIFNNRRVTHARKAFDTSEPRHLRGAYVDTDPLVSLYRVLAEKYGSAENLR